MEQINKDITKQVMEKIKSHREDRKSHPYRTSGASKKVKTQPVQHTRLPSGQPGSTQAQASRQVSPCTTQESTSLARSTPEIVTEMIQHIKTGSSTLTLGTQELAILHEIVANGGGSDMSIAILAEALSEFKGKSLTINIGYTYHRLQGNEKKKADDAFTWAKGHIARAVNYMPDFLLQAGFNAAIVPMLRTTSDRLNPKSIEGVVINGVSSLSGKNIKHCVRLAQGLDVAKARNDQTHPSIETLFELLRQIEVTGNIPESAGNLTLSQIPANNLHNQEGVFLIRGVAILPNGELQPTLFICLRTCHESAFLGLMTVDKKKAPQPDGSMGTLIPVMFNTDTASVDKAFKTLQDNNIFIRDNFAFFKVLT